ncbi:MAG TPA: tol-pal system protein YbgF [Coxiellaceae bacterium]|nr:tol-pal system protein YbgF [Coxiellaceae bacterium]
MSLNNFAKILVCTGALSLAVLAKAAAPVEEIGDGSSVFMSSEGGATSYPAGDDSGSFTAPSNNSQPAALNLSDAQRLTRVERQTSSLLSMNLPQQISDLQQQMQQLNGQLQEMQHQLKTLSEQQTSFYQDLDQRINHLKGGVAVGANPATTAKATPMTPDAKLKESDEYQAAVNLLMKKNYAKAGAAFKAYLTHYPQGTYTANAYYWLGEVNLMTKKLTDAAMAFQTVITKYPKSDKIADARLKLAMVHAQQGSVPMAKAELKKIKADYPGSTIAQLASIQLQQLDAGALNSN